MKVKGHIVERICITAGPFAERNEAGELVNGVQIVEIEAVNDGGSISVFYLEKGQQLVIEDDSLEAVDLGPEALVEDHSTVSKDTPYG